MNQTLTIEYPQELPDEVFYFYLLFPGRYVMILKEKIIEEINKMDVRRLSVVYDNIINLKKTDEHLRLGPDNVKSLEEIHAILSSTPGNWSSDIISQREDRV